MERSFFWVGVSGVPGQPSIGLGKSTLGRALVAGLWERTGQEVHIIPMATGLKQVAALQGHPLRAVRVYQLYRDWGHEHARAVQATRATLAAFLKYPSRPGSTKNRPLLQNIGTEVGRDIFGEGAWVDLVVRLGNAAGAAVVISDDVRFDNEARAVDLLVGIDPRMNPQGVAQNHQGLDSQYTHAAHRSEQALTQWPDWRMAPRWNDAALDRLVGYVAQSVQSKFVLNSF